LFQLPVRTKVVELGNMATGAITILVQTVIFFYIPILIVDAMSVHVYASWLPDSSSL
jgi:hypothetical protein